MTITEETGIKVPAITPGQAVADLAKATLRLAQDAGLRARMGKASRRRVADQFNWDKKGALIAKLYD